MFKIQIDTSVIRNVVMVVCGFSSILFQLRSLISVGMAVTIHQLKVRWVHPRTFCDVFCEKPFCERIRNKFVLFDRFMAVVKPFKYLSFMKNRHFIQMISFSWMIPIAVESSKTVTLQPSGFFFQTSGKSCCFNDGNNSRDISSLQRNLFTLHHII